MLCSSLSGRSIPLWLGLFLSATTTQPIEPRDDADYVSIHTHGFSAYSCLSNTPVSDFQTSYPAYWGGVSTYDVPEANLPSGRPMSFSVDPLPPHPDGWDYKFYTRADCTFDDAGCALKPDAKGCVSPPVGVWIAKVAIKAPVKTITSTVVVTATPAGHKRTAEPAVITAVPKEGQSAPPVTHTVTSTKTG